jgi:hypothetical protein
VVSRVPGWLLRHRITVAPYRGDSAHGPRYGPAVEGIPALVAAAHRQLIDGEGREAIATAQIIAAPGLDCPPGSRVTLPDGRTTRAITVNDHSAPGLPVPQCTEVMCE